MPVTFEDVLAALPESVHDVVREISEAHPEGAFPEISLQISSMPNNTDTRIVQFVWHRLGALVLLIEKDGLWEVYSQDADGRTEFVSQSMDDRSRLVFDTEDVITHWLWGLINPQS